MKLINALFLFVCALACTTVMAQGLPQVPTTVDWTIAKGPWGIASVAIVVLVQIVSTILPEFAWKRSLVSLLAVVYGIGATVASSTAGNLSVALITALFTGGGAVALFEAAKGIFTGIKGKSA